MPHMLYGDPSFKVVHDDPLHHSQVLGGNPWADIDANHASIDSSYASGHINYFFVEE